MKPLILAVALLSASPAFAQSFVPGTGCVWNEQSGTCTVANDTMQPAVCDVRIEVTTTSGKELMTRRRVHVMPKDAKRNIKVNVKNLEDVRIAALCKPE